MIAIKLIAQSFLGVSAIVGISASTAFLVSSNDKNNYYLMISDSQRELFSPVTSLEDDEETIKKYKCQLSLNVFDEDCEIFSIEFDTQKQSINFSQLQDFVKSKGNETNVIKKVKEQDVINPGNFFLLKTNKAIDTSIKLDWNSKINLLNKEPNKSSSFTVYSKITKNKSLGKVNHFIAKVTKADGGTISSLGFGTKNTCTIKSNPEIKKLCYIYPLETTPLNKTYKDIDFSKTQTWTLQTETTPTKGSYYLINLERGSEIEISDLENKSIIFTEEKFVPVVKNLKENPIQLASLGSSTAETDNTEQIFLTPKIVLTTELLMEAPVLAINNSSGSSNVVILK